MHTLRRLLATALLTVATLTAADAAAACGDAASCTRYMRCPPDFELIRVSDGRAYCKGSNNPIPHHPTCTPAKRYTWQPDYTDASLKGARGACVSTSAPTSTSEAAITCGLGYKFNKTRRLCEPLPNDHRAPGLSHLNMGYATGDLVDNPTQASTTREVKCEAGAKRTKRGPGYFCVKVTRAHAHVPRCSGSHVWDPAYSSKATGAKKGMCVTRGANGQPMNPDPGAIVCDPGHAFDAATRKCAQPADRTFQEPSLGS